LRARSGFLILPLLLLAGAGNVIAQRIEIETNQELESYRTELDALEAANGLTSPQLIETLEQLADRLMVAFEYQEAHDSLDRAQQILRINEGLYTPSQQRILQKKIENFTNWGDWRSTRELLDHRFWLYANKTPRPDDTMVAGLLNIADMHLRGVLEDNPRQQANHYRRAAFMSRAALTVAEAIWQPQDLRFAQVIYEQIRHAYLHGWAIQSRAQAGYALRSIGWSSASGRTRSMMLERDQARDMHRGTGFLYFERLRKLYLDRETPDLEASAMVTLYQADWQLLFQQREMAVVTYANAHAELLAAGVSEQLVDDLFATPVLIPELNFYPDMSAALQSRLDSEKTMLRPVQNLPIRLSFNELSPEALLSSENNRTFATAFADPGEALFIFRLAGVDELRKRRWFARNPPTLGVAQNLQIIIGVSSLEQQEELVSRVNWLRFRPKLVDGVPQAASGVLASKL
ncbi:MAG TPA: hypothetical protein QGI39_03545, partial [Gammaproteobacteria bacterium]|nr:hypothetical protein [Gammaproteobacteria bacterium]